VVKSPAPDAKPFQNVRLSNVPDPLCEVKEFVTFTAAYQLAQARAAGSVFALMIVEAHLKLTTCAR
jgi:hypothetical protein